MLALFPSVMKVAIAGLKTSAAWCVNSKADPRLSSVRAGQITPFHVHEIALVLT